MSVASLHKIGALIREKRHVLIARWRRQARTLPSAQGMDVPTLNDHIPYLIDELADALESQPDDSAEEVLLRGSPPAHGRQRLHDGFNVEEVVAEYNALRACIHDLAEEQGIVIHGGDLRVVNRIIDEAIGLAVQTYATQLLLEIKKHRDLHLAFVANDLRTPLQAISLTVGIIESTITEAAANERAEKLLKILRRNILQLEKSVIEVIKANADSPSDAAERLERREIDLWPLVEAIIHGLDPVVATSSVELVNNVPEDLCVFGDAGLLTCVFENLLSFAINGAPRGTVRVEASDAGRNRVCCRVSHNGADMPADELANLFKNGMADKQSREGIGLGLAIVRQAVEAHGGEISAESSVGNGVTIEFRLPAGERSP